MLRPQLHTFIRCKSERCLFLPFQDRVKFGAKEIAVFILEVSFGDGSDWPLVLKIAWHENIYNLYSHLCRTVTKEGVTFEETWAERLRQKSKILFF